MRSLLFASLAAGVVACFVACGAVPDIHFVDSDASSSSSSSGSSSGSGSGGGSGSSSGGVVGDDGGEDGGIVDAAPDGPGPCQEAPPNPPSGTQCCGANGPPCRGQPGKCAGQTCTSAAACGQCSPFEVCCLRNNGDWQACVANVGDCPNPN